MKQDAPEKQEGTHNATVYGYYAELRVAYESNKPLVIGDMNITKTWKRLDQLPIGFVPVYAFGVIAEEQHLLTYASAVALAAYAVSMFEFSSVEYRIAKIKLEYSWKMTRVGETEPIDLLRIGNGLDDEP